MTTLIQKMKINKQLEQRKNFVLSLALIGFKIDDTNFNHSPLKLHHKTLPYDLQVMNKQSLIITENKLERYQVDNNAKDIKEIIEKLERIKKLKNKFNK